MSSKIKYRARKCPNISLQCSLTPYTTTRIIMVSPNANSQQPCHIHCKKCNSNIIHITQPYLATYIPVNSAEHLRHPDPTDSQQEQVVRNRMRNKWSMKTIIMQIMQSQYLRVLFSTLQNVSLVILYDTQDST